MKKFKKIMLMGVFAIGGVLIGASMVHAGFGQVTDVTAIKGLGAETATAGGSASLLNTVKSFVNWVLGLLSLIALIVLLYGGFNMVTAAGDDAKYKKGFKILQQAAIGLAVIGLSWIIVSFIFYIISPSGGGTVVTP